MSLTNKIKLRFQLIFCWTLLLRCHDYTQYQHLMKNWDLYTIVQENFHVLLLAPLKIRKLMALFEEVYGLFESQPSIQKTFFYLHYLCMDAHGRLYYIKVNNDDGF